MHDILLAIAFLAMFFTPAMVATLSGKKEYEPEPDQDEPAWRVAPRKTQVIHPHSLRYAEPPAESSAEAPTLPTRIKSGTNFGGRLATSKRP